MNNKLRKIVVDDLEYLYIISDKYHFGTGTNTLTVKIFLNGQKQTPLVINFLTLDHFYMGQLLRTGISLENKMTNTTERINLNEPKYIRELILYGRKMDGLEPTKLNLLMGWNFLKN